jgi:phosphoglycerate-specific signal transduction histidine kinase
LLFLLTASGLNAEELTNHHLLTLTELEERVKQESDSVNLQFAIIRMLGQTDQSRALLVLAKLDPTQWNQSEALIAATVPFYSTKGPAGGSGLGLVMVEGFMNQSAGQLAITSTLGVGTTVSLSFVAEVADAPKTAAESRYCW